jgi:hypothetical protein
VSDQEIIHFPAHMMQFGSICRQRCAWCGALIQERDLASIAMLEADRAPKRQGKPIDATEIGWWDGLVAVSGTNPVMLRAVDDPPDGKAPERSCMVLMPEDIEGRQGIQMSDRYLVERIRAKDVQVGDDLLLAERRDTPGRVAVVHGGDVFNPAPIFSFEDGDEYEASGALCWLLRVIPAIDHKGAG